MQQSEFRSARSPRKAWLSMLVMALVTVLFVSLPGSAAAAGDRRTGQPDQDRVENKIVPYVIADPYLVQHPERLLIELREHGDLSRLGISPATENGPSRIEGQAAVEEEPRSYVVDSSRFPRGTIPADIYQYAEFGECHASDSPAFNNDGWIKNRYSYCQIHLLVMPAFRCGLFPPRCQLVGTFMSRNTVIGYGKAEGWSFQGLPEWRYANFLLDVQVLEASGPFNSMNATMEAEIECGGAYRGDPPAGVDPDNACTPGGRDVTKRPVKEWQVNPSADFDIGSEGVTPGPDQGEQIAVGEFHFDYDFDLPGQWFQFLDPESPTGGMRFDSAWYNRQSNKGSVFDRAVPGLSHTKSDPAVSGVAKHIDDARSNPAATFPAKPDKVLHGATPSDPLHRLAGAKSDELRARADDNRRIATNFCRTVAMPPQPPTGGPFDCDEYAFAASYEGAARFLYEGAQYELDYSVQWVNSTVNQEEGARRGRWYDNDRILDSEAFFVPIKP